uniref:FAM234A/B beta-propeller domain-containing protein n=1 Tax=Sphenodon punctatus TaxID=8508 RepID=A0A8D0GVW5_SPHPU
MVISTTTGDEVQSFFLSGKYGDQIGSNVSLSMDGKTSNLVHVTKTDSFYVLFYTANSLYGYALKDLYSMATGSESQMSSLKRDPQWEKMIDSTTHRIPLSRSSSGEIHYLLKVPGRSGKNILVVKLDTCELLDGQSLASLWVIETANVLSEPVLGYYRPDVLDIVIESEVGPNRKKVWKPISLFSLPLVFAYERSA